MVFARPWLNLQPASAVYQRTAGDRACSGELASGLLGLRQLPDWRYCYAASFGLLQPPLFRQDFRRG
jgi:hypothetical protein